MSNYGKLTAGLIGTWLILALGASALHLFLGAPNRPPLAMGLAAVAPIALFLAWFAGSRKFREFTLSLDPRVLTLLQSWRVAGFVFLVLAAYGILPKAFAVPAGWGDIFIGATSIYAAFWLAKAEHRLGFLVWQVLGIADLVLALTLGTVLSMYPHSPSTSELAVLPLSFIPTFGVPLMIIFHVICIAQALRWPGRQMVPVGHAFESPAA